MCSTWFADGLRRDHEPLGDLLVREPAREQPQDLDLARGQARGAFAPARDAVPGRAEHGLDGVGVEAAGLHLRAQLGRRVLGGQRRRGEGGARASPGRRRRRRGSARRARWRRRRARAGSPSRRARSRCCTAIAPSGAERLGLVQHAIGQVGMQAHALPLAGAERAALVPDRVRDPETAEVVHEPGAAQRRRLVGQARADAPLRRPDRRPRGSDRACTAT